jgi:hypothetical protein
MAERSESGRRHAARVVVDVRGVTGSTRVGELTVNQFVNLLFQLDAQLPTRRASADPRIIERVLAAIRLSMAHPPRRDTAVSRAVRKTQRAVLADVSTQLRAATRGDSKRRGRTR